MKSPENFQQWWAASEEGQATIAANVVAGVEKRQALAAEDERNEAELLKARVAPQKKIVTATSEVAKAQQALADAQLVLQREQSVLQNINHKATTRKAQIEATLREGAHPGVIEFLASTGELWERERREWSWSAPTHEGVAMPAKVRLAQIRSISERAEALLLEADPTVAERALVTLRDELANPMAAVA